MPSATTPSLYLVVIAATFIASTATVHHDIPEQLLKRHYAHPLPPVQPFIPTFDFQQAEYLKAHNALRQQTGVPPLIWSAKLTKGSHNWAEQRRVDCNYRTHSRNKHGENIYWMMYKEKTPTEIVHWWYNEYNYYDNTTFSCTCMPERPGCECGHYLNVIWSTTKKVGCGSAYCVDQKGIIVVCQYDPPGLTPGINPFTGHPLDTQTQPQVEAVGTQPQVLAVGVGIELQPQPQGVGTQSQPEPQVQGVGTQSQPQAQGVGTQSQPQDQGVATHSQPQEQGVGTQCPSQVQGVGTQSQPVPQMQGVGTQPQPQAQEVGTQPQPQGQEVGFSLSVGNNIFG